MVFQLLPTPVNDQIVQSIAKAIWNRPRLRPFREKIEALLNEGAFKDLTKRAFEQINTDNLPFFDEGYITMPQVQEQLSAFIVDGDEIHLDELHALYAKRFLDSKGAPDVREKLAQYLYAVRDTFVTHPDYGPLILIHSQDKMQAVLTEIYSDVSAIREDIREFLRTVAPTIKPKTERMCPNMAVAPDKFGGREARLNEIMAKIKAGTDTAITAVHGLGGIGKTTLAKALAARMYDEKIFRAVLWADVTSSPDPATIMNGWVVTYADSSFDVSAFQGDMRQMAAATRQQLEGVINEKCEACEPPRVLVVLDDVWDSGLEAARLLRAACPVDSTILITTRSENVAITLGAAAESLAYLTPDEAVEMLREYLKAEGYASGLRRLGVTLGGHALALELAARRILREVRPGEDEAAKLARLTADYEAGVPAASPFATLKLEAGDKKEDNLTVSLYQSYVALDADAQRRFRALGILAYDATFSPEALAALWGESLEDTYEHANALRLLSLLEIDGTRYRQHRLLRAYGRALLAEAEELDTVFGHYADFYTVRAAQIFTLPPEQWSQHDADLSDIAALGDALMERTEKGTSGDVARAMAFAYSTTYYVARRRETHKWKWLEMGLNAVRVLRAESSEDETLMRCESLFLNDLGGAWNALGEKRKALDYFEQALPLYRAVGDRGGEATTLRNIGEAYRQFGDVQKTLEYNEQALLLYRAVGDRSGEAAALNNIGLAWYVLGDVRKALDYYQQALPVFRAVGDRGGEATTLNNIGYIYFQEGELEKTVEMQLQIITIVREVGEVASEALYLFNIAVVYQRMGRINEAIQSAEAGRDILIRYNLPQNAGGGTVAQYDALLVELRGETIPAQNMLPAETINTLAGNTVAVMTSVPEQREEWRGMLQGTIEIARRENDQNELAFFEALLAILDGETPTLPEGNPYAEVVWRVVQSIEAYHLAAHGTVEVEAEAAPGVSAEDAQAALIQQIVALYRQGGAEAVRSMLAGVGVPEEAIESMLAGLESME